MSQDIMLTAYIACALWSETDDAGRPLDRAYGPKDLTDEACATMKRDVDAFYAAHAADIGAALKRAGRDLWLTRNRHGAGFWDGDWPEDVGARLTAAAHALGEAFLCVGDDGKLHHYPHD